VTASDPSLRPFEPGDLPTLQHIRQAAFEPVFRSFREIVGAEIAAIAFTHADADQAKLLDDICAAGSGHHVLVVTVGEEIVGFVSFTIDTDKRLGEIGLNAVHPGHAGRGLGTWMYEHVLVRMKELGAALATVGTGGDPSHAPARRAYEKAGFGPALPSIYLYKLLRWKLITAQVRPFALPSRMRPRPDKCRMIYCLVKVKNEKVTRCFRLE
jgi:GNAT superfamily N-acetyltransferase